MVERQSGAQVERIYNSVLMSKETAATLEKALHDKFDNQRLEGEFFNTSFEEACRALVLAVSELPTPALPALPLVDKLITIADKMEPCPERQQILIRAANLLDAHF
ncbi:MAG: GIY-YIG nuclease family protein [Quinella sp. 1Q5]|nr:GIY-YIG nuclease family protein [Quinella sp. 1Q5]